MPACCIHGFRWDASPKGQEATIQGHKTYRTGDNKERAIVILHDAWGWTSTNTRLLADHYADEIDATVYIPDFFKDDPYPFEEYEQMLKTGSIDPDWEAKVDAEFERANSRELRGNDLLEVATSLRGQYKQLGVAGYCWGGWGAFFLGGEERKLVDCISVAHPAFLIKQDVDEVDAPVQLHIPEHDPEFLTTEFREYLYTALPGRKTIPVALQHYPGMNHGFATRGDGKDPKQSRAMILAKDSTVTWFKTWLSLEHE